MLSESGYITCDTVVLPTHSHIHTHTLKELWGFQVVSLYWCKLSCLWLSSLLSALHKLKYRLCHFEEDFQTEKCLWL